MVVVVSYHSLQVLPGQKYLFTEGKKYLIPPDGPGVGGHGLVPELLPVAVLAAGVADPRRGAAQQQHYLAIQMVSISRKITK